MNWVKAAVLTAVMVSMAAPAQAQRRVERSKRGSGPVNVEAALRMREELKLSNTQISQLEALRKEIVAQRQKEAQEMIDLQSRVAAGNIERDEMRKHFEGRREAMQATAKQRNEQIDKILTEDQRAQISRSHMKQNRGQLQRAPGRGRIERNFRGGRGPESRFREPMRWPRRFEDN